MAPFSFSTLLSRSLPSSATVFEYANAYIGGGFHDGSLLIRRADPSKKNEPSPSPTSSGPAPAATTLMPHRSGSVNASDLSKGILGIFCFLAAALGIIVWVFFAKKGGFVWRKKDWDDYCSTVMRRKDANGNTIYSSSTRNPETVATEITYQDSYDDYDGQTEKTRPESRDGGGKKKKKIGGALKKLKPKWKRQRTDESVTTMTNEYDRDLESYADEEPARMSSYNPHPVNAPSVYDTDEHSEISYSPHNSRGLNKEGSQKDGKYPSRYAYAYQSSESTGVSERSQPMGPRQASKKNPRGSTSGRNNSSANRRTPVVAADPDLSTIADETETRLSFEAEDDTGFTVCSSNSPTKVPAGSRSYNYRAPSKQKKVQPRQQTRITSHGTYTSTGNSSGGECDSDCSCCTTEEESGGEGSQAPGKDKDKGTKVYPAHHLGLGRVVPKPADALVINKSRAGTPKKSYRKDSRGSLSSGSEGEGSVVDVESSISSRYTRNAKGR